MMRGQMLRMHQLMLLLMVLILVLLIVMVQVVRWFKFHCMVGHVVVFGNGR